MTFVQRHIVDATTGTGGTATVFTPVVTGRVASVQYLVGATGSSYASTVDFAITGEAHATPIWSESNVTAAKTVRPLATANTTTGGAALLATGVALRTPIFLAQDRVRIAIAQGGNTKTGRFVVVLA